MSDVAQNRIIDHKQCPYCSEEILVTAKKCKHCGEIVDPTLKEVVLANTVNTKNLALAAILSLLFPGLGQIYKGQVLNGIVWFFFTALGYVAFVVPGVIMHICCVIGATNGSNKQNITSKKRKILSAIFMGLACLLILKGYRSFKDKKNRIQQSQTDRNSAETSQTKIIRNQ